MKYLVIERESFCFLKMQRNGDGHSAGGTVGELIQI